ncbi:MAG: glycoside hydrolase family 57 protein [bacterium]|nr:glycoside hydrolase family 57 protein [bacterium]
MATVCFYFQVHQPYRLKRYSVFDVGNDSAYFDSQEDERIDNRLIARKVSQKCYVPMNRLLLEQLKRHPDFRVSFSISGVALEQFEAWEPEVLASFQALVATGQVELLSETYYHSLAFLYSHEEFIAQVNKHRLLLKRLFNYVPTTFRNTELIYNNDIARMAKALGFSAVLAEGADHILGWRSPNLVYQPEGILDIALLLKNYKLSDDIAFRFSSRQWEEWPLTVEKYSQWIGSVATEAQTINLFMDYETFGEHQWEDTGIFDFMNAIPAELLKNRGITFATPSEVAKTFAPVASLNMPHYVSWADIERDLSAWRSNPMQYDALRHIYALRDDVYAQDDPQLLDDWQKMTTSDHFYYMCTKWFADGDVHKYFSPYESPYDAFTTFMNILQDLRLRLKNNTQDVNKSA